MSLTTQTCFVPRRCRDPDLDHPPHLPPVRQPSHRCRQTTYGLPSSASIMPCPAHHEILPPTHPWSVDLYWNYGHPRYPLVDRQLRLGPAQLALCQHQARDVLSYWCSNRSTRYGYRSTRFPFRRTKQHPVVDHQLVSWNLPPPTPIRR